MESLRQKQSRFTRMVAALITWAYSRGYEMTLGQTLRTPEEAARNAEAGIGIKQSLHMLGLAIDINTFKDGAWLKDFDKLKEIGDYWESLGGAWGGNFKSRDCVHFSLPHNGIK